MALCADPLGVRCTRAVLTDGMACDRCYGQRIVGVGWARYREDGSQIARSVTLTHRRRAGDTHTLCGRQVPEGVVGNVGRAELCVPCVLAEARETTHRPMHVRHRTGGSAWRGGATWGVVWRLGCSCGLEEHSNISKREVDRDHREHVLAAVRDGMFRLEEDRREPRVVELSRAATAFAAASTGPFEWWCDRFRELPVGLAVTSTLEHAVRVTRLSAPVLITGRDGAK